MIARLARIALICLFIPLFAAPAFAQEKYPVGRIIALEGVTYVINGENRLKMRVDDPVYLYNTIRTGPHARALILLIDDTEIILGEDSEFVIDEYVFDPYDPEENSARFSIVRGVFQFVSGMINKRSKPDVKIETAYGSIGIRGTMFWGGKMKDRETYGVFVQEGEVEFNSDGGNVSLPAGTGTFLTGRDAAPLPANAWRPMKVSWAAQTVAFNNEARLKQIIEEEMIRNIQRRHEYRKIMWPYKEMPYGGYGDEDDPHTREFRELKQRHRDRMRLHDQRMREWQRND